MPSLLDTIRQIRFAKTATEEREIIARECADIRTSFKKEETKSRVKNILKLIYFHILGYPTKFAQIECLKLIASTIYAEKRVGYLALTMMSDENQEVLMLATNSIKKDLNHSSQHVVSLALTAIGNIASTEIARDCSDDVEVHLSNANAYIRKKAILASLRILRKAPDLLDQFIPRIPKLLEDRNHGVILTTIALINEMCKIGQNCHKNFAVLVPHFVEILSALLQYTYSLEYDIGGVFNPFLQVKILQLLRVLGKGNREASERMSAILTSIASNADGTHNAGNSVLYECVNTIMGIESDSGLKILAINTLVKLLFKTENNNRYVVLNIFCSANYPELGVIQRYKQAIFACIQDEDVSIRKRALELSYSLVNEQNVESLVQLLIGFLQKVDKQFCCEVVAKLCIIVEKFAPSVLWHFDTILEIMMKTVNCVTEQTCFTLITMISKNPDLHSHAVHRLFEALKNDQSQKHLTEVAVWCIGEFGHYLVSQNSLQSSIDGNTMNFLFKDPTSIAPKDVMDLLQLILNSSPFLVNKYLVLTALAKFVVHVGDQSAIDQARKIFASCLGHLDLDIQQRSVEYKSILNYRNLWKSVFAPISCEKIKSIMDSEFPNSALFNLNTSSPQPEQSTNIIDALNVLDQGPSNKGLNPFDSKSTSGTIDLLSLFAPPPESKPYLTKGTSMMAAPEPSHYYQSSPNLSASNSASPINQPPTYAPVHVFTSPENLDLVLEISKPTPNDLQYTLLTAIFKNFGFYPITDFDLKVAVPKYLRLQMLHASSKNLLPNGTDSIQQQIKIVNTMHNEMPIVLKLRLEYKINGNPIVHICDVNTLPPNL
ncbi:AP-1 complex subunit gamma-like [Schistocerca gregaria]|uniref:AP-1 complex subunit gamma-like n=1 Tax=Schistocerca gregaria TaxID=7010 RepID=UPI00211DA9B7|nr:AP-1 complex subunit gamma-like [Schistocerca gregaria]